MKPGYQTSEFWLALASMLISTLAVTYGISPNDTQSLSEALSKAIVNLGALGSSVALIWRYISARESLKTLDVMASMKGPDKEPLDEKDLPFGFYKKDVDETEEEEE